MSGGRKGVGVGKGGEGGETDRESLARPFFLKRFFFFFFLNHFLLQKKKRKTFFVPSRFFPPLFHDHDPRYVEYPKGENVSGMCRCSGRETMVLFPGPLGAAGGGAGGEITNSTAAEG